MRRLIAHRSDPHGRVAWWIFLLLTVSYVLLTRGHFISTDEVTVYQGTKALWERGDLAVTRSLPSSAPGRDGRNYAFYNPGQSIAALPLYAAGTVVDAILRRLDRTQWTSAFAGPLREDGEIRWGGETPIFFVNLFNALMTGLLGGVFYLSCVRLGTSTRSALVATFLLSFSSFVAPFSTGFYQHSSEALFLLWSFFLLHEDAHRPDWRSRCWAGSAAGWMLLVRFPSGVALPALGLYLVSNAWRRHAGISSLSRRLRAVLRETAPFAVPVSAALDLDLLFNYWKFGSVSFIGGYTPLVSAYVGKAPLLPGLYGLLLSPGDSIFLFTPLLLLLPWTLCTFARSHRGEAAFIVVVTVSYLLLYARVEFWHGMWCFGPRYLMPLVPILMLPLGPWLDRHKRWAWFAVLPLALAGVWAQTIHAVVNWWYVIRAEKYLEFQPQYDFLYHLSTSPFLAQSRAFLAFDWRTDTWLVSVYRRFGSLGLLACGGLPAAGLGACLWMLARALRQATLSVAQVPAASSRRLRQAFVAVLSAALAIALSRSLYLTAPGGREANAAGAMRDGSKPILEAGRARLVRPDALSDEAGMRLGLNALQQRNPSAAAEFFRNVLAHTPTHYGATYQLATALEAAGRSDEALPLWRSVLEMADGYGDTATASSARSHLNRQSLAQ